MNKFKYNFVQSVRILGQFMFSGKLFSIPGFYSIKIFVYKLMFGFKGNIMIGRDVYFDRTHKKNTGFIKVGNNVKFVRHIHIDYTGFLTIKDNVIITSGVHIYTHHRDLDEHKKGNDVNIQDELIIEENTYIGTNAIILSSCHYIGKNARIGANSVVTKDVPDNALVGGVPAKLIRMID